MSTLQYPRTRLEDYFNQGPQHPVGPGTLGSVPGVVGETPVNPYKAIIDGILSQGKSDIEGERTADLAGLNTFIQRALIGLGIVPEGIAGPMAGLLQGALSPEILALIEKNNNEGLSTMAQLNRANATELRRIPALLAGRGLLRSGQTGHDLGEQAQRHKIAVNNALQAVLANLEGAGGSYLLRERDRQTRWGDLLRDAPGLAMEQWGGSMPQTQTNLSPPVPPAIGLERNPPKPDRAPELPAAGFGGGLGAALIGTRKKKKRNSTVRAY